MGDHDYYEPSIWDTIDESDFAQFCQENDLDPEDGDSIDIYREAEAEARDPYGSRGLSPRDFL